MSCLKLYWPRSLSLYAPVDEGRSSAEFDDREAVIIPFPRVAARLQQDQNAELLSRARLVRDNSRCPACRRVAVEPVEAQPVLINRNWMPVPGTGTIIGFRCQCCEHEWSA